MNRLIHHVLEIVKPSFALDVNHGIHGIAHWSRVWMHGRFLCNELDLDPKVPCVFAFMHDSCRWDDYQDSEHGYRASEFAFELHMQGCLGLKKTELDLLMYALRHHSDGQTDADQIVQVCWDSDRLDLGRCGTRPLPQYLCTEPAKRPEVIQRAWDISQRFINR